MKLTREQVAKIDAVLIKDKIFYDDVRHELVDHIASALEEQQETGSDFDAALARYMNSHHKVKLLTAARQQEEIKDRHYLSVILKKLLTGSAILFFVMVFLIISASTFNIWAYRFFEMVLILGLFYYMAVEPWIKHRLMFFKRLHNTVFFYHLVFILIILNIQKLLGETQPVLLLKGFLLSLLFTVYYLVYRMNNTLKSTRHA